MLSLEREDSFSPPHMSRTRFIFAKQFCDLWSAQRNLLNSFINFLPDWKINYHFFCVEHVVACLLYRSSERSTVRRKISQHTQASPFMVPEWPTRFLTFFHSHFLQFLSLAVLFLREIHSQKLAWYVAYRWLHKFYTLPSSRWRFAHFKSTRKSSSEVKVKF